MTNALISALAGRRIFVAYRRVRRPDGKLDKVPTAPDGVTSDAQDPRNWLLPEDAQAAADALNLMPRPADVEGYGVGLVISKGCGLAFIDFDHCREANGGWQPHVRVFETWFPGAYRETSVSRTGRHIVCSYTGEPPLHGTRNADYRMECYTSGRFMAVGDIDVEGSPLVDCTAALFKLLTDHFPKSASGDATEWTDNPVAEWKGPPEDEALLAIALRMNSTRKTLKGGAQFRDLHIDGPNTIAKHYGGDESSADQGYFNYLAWLTGKDCERMLRIAQRSDCSLRRDKWVREDYLRRTILEACAGTKDVFRERDPAAVPVPTESDRRPVILLEGGKLDQYATEAEGLLADLLYVHGGNLVRIGRAAEVAGRVIQRSDGSKRVEDDAGTQRELDQAICISASSAWLRRALMARAQFWKFDKRSKEYEPRDCPKELADNIAEQRSWATFRSLTAISGVPVLRPDLSVWRQPGYDHETQVFYQPTMVIPPILDAPTRDDALAALARLREPFSEFPFKPEAAAESVFLSNIITAVIRASFDTSPVYCYTAPIAGSGKTLLAQMPQLIATGSLPPNSPYSEREELRKVLFASLLAGDSSLILDNIGNGEKVRSPILCGFVTSSNYSDRVLGASKLSKMPNRCTVALTGNNITPMSDLARRSLPCRLDVGAESARGRKFRIADLKGYVRERRAQLIVDVFTLVRAYAFAGRPEVAHPLESFEQWSRLARNPLVWLGLPDPVASQETETDDETAPLRGAFTAIAAATHVQEHRFTASQLTELIVPQAPTTAEGLQRANALREALIGAACKNPAEKVGYWLREQKDRVAGGFKLVGKLDKNLGIVIWQLRAVAGG
jgi:putative DNA primase/helicase